MAPSTENTFILRYLEIIDAPLTTSTSYYPSISENISNEMIISCLSPSRDLFAAFTIASTSSVVISPFLTMDQV